MLFGFAIALVSMVFFGLYMVPRKFCRLQNMEFVLSMGVGVLLTTLIGWAVVDGGKPLSVSPAALAYAFACGPIWAFGMIGFTWAVAEIGLTLATPIKNTTAVMGTLIGLVFFGETATTIAWRALAGSALIVLCAAAIGQTGGGSEKHYSLTRRGVIYSLLAAVFFAAYTYPLKKAMGLGMDSYFLIFVMALGTLATAAIGQQWYGVSLHHWWKQPVRDHLAGALAGGLWAIATMAMNAGIARIGLAVTWPITNLNTIIAVFIGSFFYHEVHLSKHWPKLALGMLYATLGVLLLGISKLK